MKTCLVLEGGGLRGIYTAGVLDEMFKDKIKIDAIIGVSMGALIGINYKSKQPERAIRYNLRYCNDKRYMGFRSFLKTGNIANKEFAYYKIPNELDKFDYDTYKKTKMKMYVTVTNLETGEAEYIEIKDAKDNIEYFRATSSMPGVSKIVEIDGKKYLDGGVADSIPVKKALDLGYDRVIVVLTRPIEYRKKETEMKWLQSRYKKYPKFMKAIAKRNKSYNEKVERIIKLEKEGKVFCIRPSKRVNIKRIEKNERIILEQYNLGKRDYLNCEEKLREFIKRK